ncbi:MAG: 2-oxoglutarate dehydrogenase E1 component [Candidatus Eisenbacteria bacterium]|nr:2-oxoglutarate dehydrogenase E1 component [Candidatus Eisenbacteria bacterium]
MEQDRKAERSGRPVAPAHDLGMNAGIVEILRERFALNPNSVPPEWADFFRSSENGQSTPSAPGSGSGHGASTSPPSRPAPSASASSSSASSSLAAPASAAPASATPPVPPATPPAAATSAVTSPGAGHPSMTPPPGYILVEASTARALDQTLTLKNSRVLRMIHAFRARGHRIAETDPLGMRPSYFPEVDPAYWGFDESDMEREFVTGDLYGGPLQPLGQILEHLRETYTRSVGVEFTHIQDPERKNWLIDQMESTRNRTQFSNEERLRILRDLAEAELFENFVHTRFVGQKRFSLEGGESLIPLLEELVEESGAYGIREYVLGMAHRGRLNVLCNILDKSKEMIFSEFEDIALEMPFGSGDVKYHKGYSSNRKTRTGYQVHLSLTSNPSHLEAVNPVVEGRARAKQTRDGDEAGARTVPVLIHGDAAFAGQGIVAETLNLSQLQGYTTGGTVHIVVDNQIGFTTTPAEARSSLYATDVAKMIQVPIFHVNGDHPEAVVHVTRLALAYRQKFRSDVVIALVCYRKHGHNEGDEPMFTQPLLYGVIKEKRPVRQMYRDRLIAMNVLSKDEAEAMENEFKERLDKGLESIKTKVPKPEEPYEPRGVWDGFSRMTPEDETPTHLSRETLVDLMARLTELPDSLHVHPKLKKLFEKRQDAVRKGVGLDWSFGETMAYASLLEDGYNVRLSGQDSSRGTFSHRHAVIVDQLTGAEYTPLAHLTPKARFEVYDSLLSEAAVLGYEYGYSLADPMTLVIWEAQFGDFVNGAQVIIDQFIASAHVKWGRMSGLTMMLPHGYEGQGPEHSSARIERFLQLCAEDNLQVANCTTPAQIFHLLRRQMVRNYRAPLIVFTPKSLLRHPRAVSTIEEFTEGRFQRVVDDPAIRDPQKVQRVLLCSGKVYYDLSAERKKRGSEGALDPDTVAIVRVEQVYPWPAPELERIFDYYASAEEICWVQEEPQNDGAWFFAQPRLQDMLAERCQVRYVGRPEGASPAVGSARLHHQRQAKVLSDALGGLPERKVPPDAKSPSSKVGSAAR